MVNVLDMQLVQRLPDVRDAVRRDRLDLRHQPGIDEMRHHHHRAGGQVVLEELFTRRADFAESSLWIITYGG